MDIVFLIIGFVLLIEGADFFVSGASDIARKLRVSTLIIGLTIVAFGTSAPELAVSINASSLGSSAISVGNIVGSNTFNLLVVLGISSVIAPCAVSGPVIKKDYPVSMVASVLICIFAAMPLFAMNSDKTLTRPEGIILLAVFAAYMLSLFYGAKKHTDIPPDDQKEVNIVKALIFLGGGIAGIIFGSQMVVSGATGIARALGVSEEIIGYTIVAVGTSLPELVTSIVAAKKGENDIAIGNVVGSNIFNLLLIGGICSVISPTVISDGMLLDMIYLLIITAICFIPILICKKIPRAMGAAMVCMYAVYTVYMIISR